MRTLLQAIGLFFLCLNAVVLIGGYFLIMHFGWGLSVQNWNWIVMGPISIMILSLIFKTIGKALSR